MTSPYPGMRPVEPMQPMQPMVHSQQSAGARLLRVVVVVLVLRAWLLNVLNPMLIPGFDPATSAALDYSIIPWLVTLVLLITGPQPRWATKWAWFWLIGLSPMVAVFLLVEPVPVWQTEPLTGRPWRLTGGRAFVLTLVVGLVYVAVAQALRS